MGDDSLEKRLRGKVGLITLFSNNYGSILQAYSTKTFVESLGMECDVFQIVLSQSFLSKIWRKVCLLGKMIAHPSFYKLYSKQKKGWKKDGRNLAPTTERLMSEFVNRELTPLKVSVNELNDPLWQKQYDYFITGSDQVWNVRLFVNPANFLSFTSPQKKIAFAVSYGITEIPKYNQRAFCVALNGFNYISVREETGQKITEKYSAAKVCRIGDPTLIFSDKDWRYLTREEDKVSFKYILVHFLNKPSSLALESIEFLSNKFKLDVLVVGYNYEAFGNIKRAKFIDGDPLKYVSLIDNSEMILTDSFHTTLFSINFNKSFFVFQRQYSTLNEGSRIMDLLERFDLRQRFVVDINDMQHCVKIAPKDCGAFLSNERVVVRDYLKKSVSGEIPQIFL